MSALQMSWRVGAVVVACAGCSSSPARLRRPGTSAPSLGTVVVQGPSTRPASREREETEATAPPPPPKLPSLEIPYGLSENGRDQYGALVAYMLTLVDDLTDADRQIPLDCSPALRRCATRWIRLSESLHHVIDELDAPWFDCHGLEPVDRRAFLESSARFKDYVVARVRGISDRVEWLVARKNWGDDARRAWLRFGVDDAVDAVSEPSCD